MDQPKAVWIVRDTINGNIDSVWAQESLAYKHRNLLEQNDEEINHQKRRTRAWSLRETSWTVARFAVMDIPTTMPSENRRTG